MSYKLVFTKQAQRDAKKLQGSPLATKAKELLRVIQNDPFQSPPPFEALRGDLNVSVRARRADSVECGGIIPDAKEEIPPEASQSH